VQQEAATARIGEVDAALFAIAVVEAFTNVFRHGDGLLDGAPVELLLRRTARKLVVELVYLGDAFQPPDRIPDTNFQDYPEGGFGLTIIASACERVEYQHNHGVNTTRLSCRIDAN